MRKMRATKTFHSGTLGRQVREGHVFEISDKEAHDMIGNRIATYADDAPMTPAPQHRVVTGQPIAAAEGKMLEGRLKSTFGSLAITPDARQPEPPAPRTRAKKYDVDTLA